MKVAKHWNNISDKLKKEIPKLKKGQVVTFQMLNGKKNDEPDTKYRERNPTLYPGTQIPTKDRIYDPYQKDEAGNEVGGYVDIIVAKNWVAGEPSRSKFFLAGEGESIFGGKFSLTAGKVEDDELYEIFWLSNYRKGNPNRDETITPLFEIVDIVAQSKAKVSLIDQLRTALNKAEKMDVKEARKIAASLNWPAQLEDDVLLSNINEYASKEPEHFLKIAVDNPVTDLKAEIKEALDAKLITFDSITGKVTVGTKHNLLTTFDKKDDFNLLEELAAFLSSATNGQDVLKSICKQLKK